MLGAGGTADEAVALAEAHRPALAILDVSMPGGGIEAARRIRAVSPATRIAMLTVSEADQDVPRRCGAGAIGYVLKGVSAAELVDDPDRRRRGEAHVSPGLAARLLKDIERPRRARRAGRSTSSASARRTSCAASRAA